MRDRQVGRGLRAALAEFVGARLFNRGAGSREAGVQGVSTPARRPGHTGASAFLVFGALAFVLVSGTPSLAQDNLDGLSIWGSGNKRSPATVPTTGAKKDRKRSKKYANHASTIADSHIAKSRRGVYKTIMEAFSHTAPGGLITVLPGDYNEHLDIDWPVRISGAARVGQRVPGRKSGMTPSVPMAIVRPNPEKGCLTVSVTKYKGDDRVDIQDISFEHHPRSLNSCIEYKKGTFSLTQSRIKANPNVPGIVLGGSKATLELNEVVGGSFGIYVTSGAGFSSRPSDLYTLNSNVLWKNDVGLEIDSHGAYVEMNGNLVEKNTQDGVVVFKGVVVMDENDIKTNDQHGVVIYKGDVKLINSVIAHNEKDGVIVSSRDPVRLTGNEIIANKRFGLNMPEGPDAILEDNTILCNGRAGIVTVSDAGFVTVSDEQTLAEHQGNIIDKNPPYEKRFFRRNKKITMDSCAEDWFKKQRS